MKRLVLCLFAVCCCWLADASSNDAIRIKQRRKLEEVRQELKRVNRTLQNGEMRLTTPPENIEECCSLSALRCFRDIFQEKFNTTEKTQKRLYRSLKNPLTEEALDFCDSRDATCQDCNSHPQENVRTFFSRLDSLIQKAINKMRVN